MPPRVRGKPRRRCRGRVRSRGHPAGGARRPAPLGRAVPERRPRSCHRQRHGVFFRLHAALLLLPEFPHQPAGGRQGDFRRAAFGNFSGIAAGRCQKHQPCHRHPVSAVGHRSAGHRPRPRAAAAHRLQHRRLRNGGNGAGAFRVCGHLAGGFQICLVRCQRRAFGGCGLSCRCRGGFTPDAFADRCARIRCRRLSAARRYCAAFGPARAHAGQPCRAANPGTAARGNRHTLCAEPDEPVHPLLPRRRPRAWAAHHQLRIPQGH